jgi:Putative metallopeptidase
MAIQNLKRLKVTALAVALAAGAASGAAWAQNAQNTLGNLSNNASIFIDGKTFEIRGGTAKGDVAAQMRALGARELGGGAIVFRSGDKLYIVGGGGDQSALLPPEGPVHVVYEEPKDPALNEIRNMVMARRGLERFRELISPFRLPEDLYIRAVSCDGIPNAYFFREKDIPTIRVCYEYLKEVQDKLPKETTPQGIEPQDALMGQLVFALLHEFGHAAFDIFNVPVLGRQEDAADQFATYIMLQFGGEKAHRLIRGAAYSYLGFIKALKDNPKVTLPLAAFSSDHGSPQERFYNLACIAYGYDPQIFHKVIEFDYLSQSRAKVCEYEYSNLRYAIRTLITPHVDMDKAREVIAKSFQPEANNRPPEK